MSAPVRSGQESGQEGPASGGGTLSVAVLGVSRGGVEVGISFDPQARLYTYEYAVANDAANTGAVSFFSLDIAGEYPERIDAPPIGVATDSYAFWVTRRVLPKVLPVAEVRSPLGWYAARTGAGEVHWGPMIVGKNLLGEPVIADAIVPGARLSGFAVVSPAPPGPRRMSLSPVWDPTEGGSRCGTADCILAHFTVQGPSTPPPDADQDGVLDHVDEWLATPTAALVDSGGCSGAQRVALNCPPGRTTRTTASTCPASAAPWLNSGPPAGSPPKRALPW